MTNLLYHCLGLHCRDVFTKVFFCYIIDVWNYFLLCYRCMDLMDGLFSG